MTVLTWTDDRVEQLKKLWEGGLSASQIAAELGVSPKTVSTFRTRILRKMRLSSNADLIRYALEHELS